jgi:hypothetical protein
MIAPIISVQSTKITPAFRKWDGKGSLVSFVVSLNLHRRHLNESQRAMVAAKIASLSKGANQHRSNDLSSQDSAAVLMSVSPKSVQRAKKVQESGDASLIADVESGKVAVSAAAQHVAAVQRYPRKQKRPAVCDRPASSDKRMRWTPCLFYCRY